MIRRLTSTDASEIASLHIRSLPRDFLPSLGYKFNRILYENILQHTSTQAYGYIQRGRIAGCLVGVSDTNSLFKKIILGSWYKFIPLLIEKILRKPAVAIHIFETAFYSKSSYHQTKAELLIICLNSPLRRKGIGRKLVSYFKIHLKQHGIKSFIVSAYTHNIPANKFYVSLGGKLINTFIMYNKLWNVYELTANNGKK